MQKQAIFQSKLLPYALVAPQLAIVLIFFYWPAAQAVIQSFLLQDAFGLSTSFVWFENYLELFKDPAYFATIVRTFAFSFAIAVSSLSFALLLAVMADKPLRGSTLYRTLLIWPYAVAPPVVGVLWVFMLHPSLGMLSRYLRAMGVDWNPLLNGDQAATLIILAAAWKQISYNFLFFLAGLQSIPRSVIEAAAIDGATPRQAFFRLTLPMLSRIIALAVLIRGVDLFRIYDYVKVMTDSGPGTATETLTSYAGTIYFKNADFPYASTISLFTLLLVIVTSTIFIKLFKVRF